MKKLFILAISAMLVANMSAQEQKKENCGKHGENVECCKGKQLSKAERVEMDIKRLSNELLLSDEQAEKFAVTYREYEEAKDALFQKNAPKEKCEKGKELTDKELDKMAKKRFEAQKEMADLQAKFYDKFRKDLSARQTAKVLRLNEPFGGKPCCNKQGGKFDGKPGGKFDGKHAHPHGPRPDFKDAPAK